jgi:hypothetical protein
VVARLERLGPFRLVGVAALAALLASPAHASPPEPDPHGLVGGMDHLFRRRGPPDLRVSGSVECLGYVGATKDDEPLLWYVFPRRGEPGTPRVARGLTRPGIAELERACGAYTAQLARIVRATCVDPAALVELLASPEVLSFHPPDRAGAPGRARAGGGVEEIGCARVVTSRDDRARVWTALREQWVGPAEADRAGAGVRRGVAFVQALDGDGRVLVHRDRARGDDLHLDSVVDALEPIGERGRWLVLGVRSYDAHAPGPLPRRYAFVMEVDRAGLRMARGRFEVGGARRDLLLLQGPAPASGQFRFHVFASRRLAYSPEQAALLLAPIGDARLDAAAGKAPAVALFTGSRFRVLGRSWDGMAVRPGDAKVLLADRWGAADELGPRGFDEVALATASEPDR